MMILLWNPKIRLFFKETNIKVLTIFEKHEQIGFYVLWQCIYLFALPFSRAQYC